MKSTSHSYTEDLFLLTATAWQLKTEERGSKSSEGTRYRKEMKKMPKLKLTFKLLLPRGQKGGEKASQPQFYSDVYKTVGSTFRRQDRG